MSKSTHEQEIFQRLSENVAARDAFFLGDPVKFAPDRSGQADRHGLSHVLDSNTLSQGHLRAPQGDASAGEAVNSQTTENQGFIRTPAPACNASSLYPARDLCS